MSGAESQSMHHEMLGTLNVLSLPIALVDLADFTVVATSSALLTLLGLSEAEVIGRRVTELYTPEDGAAAIVALSVLRDGVVDFYRSERRLDPKFERAAKVTAWGRSVDLGQRHFALVELSGNSPREGSPFAEYFGREPPVMALGTADHDWVITSMSSDSVDLFGMPPEELVGRSLLSLVAPEDRPGLLAAERMVNEDLSSAAKSVRMHDRSGAWRQLYCVLTELSVSSNRYFMLIPVDHPLEGMGGAAPKAGAGVGVGAGAGAGAGAPSVSSDASASRVAELERHLWRIAAEVEASGVLRQVREGPDLSSLRELGSLSAKQWEVLSRLLQGKRVRTIAREMFVSESTVRNHLSAIFERFGVHSQAELLALLRDPGPGGSDQMSSPFGPSSVEPPSS
jgi:DNA-binding CsgD family transcriptional regulator/PAS domain-containing protein